MRSRPSATWTWLPLSAALLAGCGGGGAEYEPPARRAVEHRPAVTYVSDDGVDFAPGPAKTSEPPDLTAWHTVAFRDGELRLGFTDCVQVVQIDVGPADRELRPVHLHFGDDAATCTREVRLRPSGWTRETVAVPGPITLPDARRTAHQKPSTDSGGVLQPDRRTVVIPYTAGVCADLAKADAEVRDGHVYVQVTLGGDPEQLGDGDACPLVGFPSHALARLPEPAPPGAHVRVLR